MSKTIQMQYSGIQLFSLTLARVLIGWHFLYEGLVKLFSSPAWSAESYLSGSVGPFSPWFQALTTDPAILSIVNNLNIWGLILIGTGLFIGALLKLSIISGILLLLFYYLAYPPLAEFNANILTDGNYWIVNKNLIEMAALFILYLFPTGNITGIDRFLWRRRNK